MNDNWKTISKYNSWFIQLRFIAGGLLFLFPIVLFFLFEVDFTSYQIIAILFIVIVIFLANILFQKIDSKSNKFELDPPKFSLFQIVFDLFCLSTLIYFTGGIESPLFLFFIFHMVIGSLLLSETFMFRMSVIIIILFSGLSFIEYFQLIPHQRLSGLFGVVFYNDLSFVVFFTLSFGVMLLGVVFLATRIAEDLYDREAKLLRAYEDLENAEKSKQKYIMAVVHELKSPISAASSFLDIILGGFVGKIDEPVKDKIEKANKRLQESIENINQILKISKFKLFNKIEKEKICLNDLLEDILEKSSGYISRKKLNIVNSTNGKEYNLQGDKTLLHLAFSNLINNAIKYTPENGSVIINLSRENNELILEIEDTGIGIPKNDQERIFNEYFRASNVKDIEGTGTGLSIVKQIIENHNGIIKIESPVNINKDLPGTKFRLVFN